MSAGVLTGVTVALKLLETSANIAVTIAKLNALVGLARAEGRDITADELADLAEDNRALTDEVLDLLK